MARQVYIYCDEGCSLDSVKGWVSVLTEVLGHPEEHIHIMNANELEDGLTRQSPTETTLIMPGGADLAYVRLLSRSVKTIQRVVGQGGSYIGSCAGAYFASSACIFERDDVNLRVVGERELCLFPYAAIGAVREKFCYGSEAGATIETLRCEWEGVEFSAEIYCNGGPGWDISNDYGVSERQCVSETTVLARYTEAVLYRHGIVNASPAAVVAHRYEGGSVVLCGVHPELDSGQRGKREGRYKLLTSVASAALLSTTTQN